VAFLVDGVTKLSAITLRGTAKDKRAMDLQSESLKKMFFAMAEDLRVIVIKLADRVHNMRTLRHLPAADRERIARETMEIYAPIAGRLGMGRLKGELEDLAFPFAYPEQYGWLKKTIKGKYETRLHYIERTAPVVKRKLLDADIPVVDIHARAKRMWSLYEKLQRYSLDPDKVLDLVAMRIIVPDIKDCYAAMGVIHAHYKPMPGRVKDFIALPKPNGYRSLHTTVFCERGHIAEIQIRTPEMHDHAENGIASHWAYSEAGKPQAVTAKQKELAWVNQLKNVLRDIKTSQGMADLKIDFFKNRIFVLTPHGDIKDLPEGATPLDFAYAVHSELGHRTTGALANGRIVPLSSALQSGDVVEIIKGKESKPSRSWLHMVKTGQAAKHIRTWFKRREEEDSQPDAAPPIAAPKRKPRTRPSTHTESTTPTLTSILIDGQHGLAYRLGKCCAPTTASPVIGYLTLTRGVTVHVTDCANIKTADAQRLLKADWS
jgi:GTP pyrophosphokinase